MWYPNLRLEEIIIRIVRKKKRTSNIIDEELKTWIGFRAIKIKG